MEFKKIDNLDDFDLVIFFGNNIENVKNRFVSISEQEHNADVNLVIKENKDYFDVAMVLSRLANVFEIDNKDLYGDIDYEFFLDVAKSVKIKKVVNNLETELSIITAILYLIEEYDKVALSIDDLGEDSVKGILSFAVTLGIKNIKIDDKYNELLENFEFTEGYEE